MATSLQSSPVMVAGSPEVGPPARSRPQAMSTRTHAPRARALTWYLPGVGDMSPATTDTGRPDIRERVRAHTLRRLALAAERVAGRTRPRVFPPARLGRLLHLRRAPRGRPRVLADRVRLDEPQLPAADLQVPAEVHS